MQRVLPKSIADWLVIIVVSKLATTLAVLNMVFG